MHVEEVERNNRRPPSLFLAAIAQVNRLRVERTERLEGSQTSPHRLDSGRLRRVSRFRPYRLRRHEFSRWRTPRPESSTTGGSRERFEVWQFYGPMVSATE
jgi:hypothetical protein